MKISVLHSAASLARHAQNFAGAMEKNVVPKFTKRLSLTLHKVCKYKRFSVSQIFQYIDRIPKRYTGKYVLEKTRIFACFTKCVIFHLLAQKSTHYWTRIIDNILKITYCRHIFSSCHFVKSFFYILTIFNKKSTTFKNMFLWFSINNHCIIIYFWTLVLKTILILIKFPFQRYLSYVHLNFGTKFENGHHGDFPPFWKSAILGLVDHFVVCTKNHRAIGPYSQKP